MKQSKNVSDGVKSYSGPGPAARAKAQAAKAAKQQQRMEHLRAALSEIEFKLTTRSLRPEEISHEFIQQEAGLSHATYWRYLNRDNALRCTAAALVRPASQERDPSGTPGKFLTPPSQDPVMTSAMNLRTMLETESAETKRLAEINLTLQRQLAGARALISLMDLELAAKTKEVSSKDFLLSSERSHALNLTLKLKELAELCAQHGISVDFELSTLARSPATGRPPQAKQMLPHLSIVESGPNEN